MTSYKNVSRDVIDIPQLGAHVLPGDVLETDADFTASDLFEVVKKPKEVHVNANLPDETPAPADTTEGTDQ